VVLLDVLHPRGVDAVGHARLQRAIDNQVRRHHAVVVLGPQALARAEEFQLHDVARRLARVARRPRFDRVLELPARPPFRVVTGQMRGHFVRSAHRLARAVRSEEQPLAMSQAGGKEQERARIELPAHRRLIARAHHMMLNPR
jgi:hypothetical protein